MSVSPRPGWYRDLKWIVALVACATLALTLLTISFYRLTSRSAAIRITSTLVASAFSPHGLDAETDLTAATQQLAAQGVIRPFPGLDIALTTEEVSDKSPREIRLLVFNKIAAPLYDKGAHTLARESTTSPYAEKIKKDTLLIAWLSKKNHHRLGVALVILVPLTLLLLSFAIAASHRLGRLVTPALILLGASSLPTAILLLTYFFMHYPPDNSSLPSYVPSLAVQTAQNILPVIIQSALPGYLIATTLGMLLLLAACVALFVRRHRSHLHQRLFH
jgi:hypothetical protein